MIVLVAMLAVIAGWQIRREYRPPVLKAGVRLYAYVANAGDGNVTVVDLVALKAIGAIAVGPLPSGLRVLTPRKEIWGVSSPSSSSPSGPPSSPPNDAGYAWVISAETGRVSSRIAVGPFPSAVEFSADGQRAYIASSGSNQIVRIDTAAKQITGRARTGRRPWLARLTPNGRLLLVPNRDDSTLEIFDAQTLASLATVGVAEHPEQVVVLPDSSAAFVGAGDAKEISVVDLKRNVLLSNLQLGGAPHAMILKPDGGELYVTVPDLHQIEIIKTWTAEIAESMLVGLAPESGVLNANADSLYLSDSAAGRVLPIAIGARHLAFPIPVGREPVTCAMDPSGELLLVANQESNDLAVIRLRTSSLLTMVPVGAHPTEIVSLLF
jgi:YVTN family beta-propeller protein